MTNTIRTPKEGKSTYSKRIAQATDDESWQKFRLSLKGLSTRDKLNNLCEYWNGDVQHGKKCLAGDFNTIDVEDCDICIRVDNYIKALCRGGQLFPGESLQSMIANNWNPDIKS